MRLYQERKKIKRLFYSRPVSVFLLLVVLLLLASAGRMGFRAFEARQARLQVEKEYQELLAQQERLGEKIKELEDPESLKKEAKERFNITEEGERVLVIVEPGVATEDQTARPPYQRFWEFLKNIFR